MSSQVHCQCSNSVGGTSRDASYCRGQGNPLVHPHNHCVGPYEAGGYLFGDYTVGSVYYTASTAGWTKIYQIQDGSRGSYSFPLTTGAYGNIGSSIGSSHA
eukprot:9195659-Pyramimonas_sp.AAC.1